MGSLLQKYLGKPFRLVIGAGIRFNHEATHRISGLWQSIVIDKQRCGLNAIAVIIKRYLSVK